MDHLRHGLSVTRKEDTTCQMVLVTTSIPGIVQLKNQQGFPLD